MRVFCGVDIGASASKLVLLNAEGQVVAQAVRRSGVDYAAAAGACIDEALAQAGVDRSHIARSIATGYGRDNVPWADGKMTEIACHGRGAFYHFPQRITVVDIGAQDSKVIHLDSEGRRIGFKMNRKCAAGTGAFLEEIAHRLNLPLEELNALAQRSTRELTLSSFCTVFAATEILARIRAGDKVGDIVKGAFRSVIRRIEEMDPVDGTVVMTGGVVAHNPFLAVLAEEAFSRPVRVPPDPQFIGAFGAALFAMESTSAQQHT